MEFVKMHGLGNDYLFVFGEPPADASSLSRQLSDRHYGIGSDGMIYITPPTDAAADFGMRVFNADGSEAMMCGNGIRCVGKYVYDHRLTAKTALVIQTPAGNRSLSLHPDPADPTKIASVTVGMGQATVSDPLVLDTEYGAVAVVPVSVGNPHAVVFAEDAEHFPMEILAAVSTHPMFSDGINAECVQVLSPTDLRMRVWERGSGITLACGTGACAVCAAAVHRGFSPADTPITVHLDGGDLTVTVLKNGTVLMTGDAVTVCEGRTTLDSLDSLDSGTKNG